jgi:diguanylate cyclase (GGDEF)-like protein
MLQNFRQTDCIFRYGGEEFAVILTETPAQSACIPLERLRKTFEEYNFNFKNQSFKVTVSIGVSSNTEFDDCMQMFEMADKALYEAKKSGRNMVKSSN